MASILVVCTGNVCRSPIAEGMLRSILEARFGDAAPSVASAGTAGWTGSFADPSSIAAAAELGIDISAHRARRLDGDEVRDATLVLAMSAEHRDDASELLPPASQKVFTLKELVRLLEALPEVSARGDPGEVLATRVSDAAVLRRRSVVHARDEDVSDPLGMPADAFRAVAADLQRWCVRLADALFGRAPARARAAVEGN